MEGGHPLTPGVSQSQFSRSRPMCASRLPSDRRYLSVSDVRQLAETALHYPGEGSLVDGNDSHGVVVAIVDPWHLQV